LSRGKAGESIGGTKNGEGLKRRDYKGGRG
jgi:hypothetical protein